MNRLENFASSVVRRSFQNEVPLTKNEVKPCLMEYRFIQENCTTFTSNSVGILNVGYERPTMFHNGYHATVCTSCTTSICMSDLQQERYSIDLNEMSAMC